MRRTTLLLSAVATVALTLPLWAQGATQAANPAIPASAGRVAVTHQNNVYLINADGSGRQAITTRGGANGISYPSYSWSPDGHYLLLVRGHLGRGTADLLLLNARGAVLRTLATIPSSADFAPSWATDGDVIAYVAASRARPGGLLTDNTVNSVTVAGAIAVLWRYTSDLQQACGVGTLDPSEGLFWDETGPGGVAPTMQWSLAQHIAIYSAITPSACAALDVTDLRSGMTHTLGRSTTDRLQEAALSPAGALAAVRQEPDGPRVVLAGPGANAAAQVVAPGELPTWSQDGRFLYFVQRTPGAALHVTDGPGLRTYTSAIWRANADGSHLVRLTSQDAFGFGPLSPTAAGGALVFTRVDNSWNLWRHRLPGNRLTGALIQRYGPGTQVQRLDLSGALVTLATNADRPVAQP